MKDSTTTRRRRQRPRTRKIRRHQTQPRLWPEGRRSGPVFRHRQVHVKVQERGQITAYGGLCLAHELVTALGLDRQLNAALDLLKLHLPYHESDHVLAHVYNLYVGGRCIEDLGHLQHSEAIKHLLGACRIPDPTTAGDFLRRFGRADLEALQSVIDDAREQVWRQLPKTRRAMATIDVDSTIKEVYGQCKQGADFSYTGKWSYHPQLVTLAETNEPLRTINRPGNAGSADGAADALGEVLPRVTRHFDEVFVRGDSQFYERPIIAQCRAHGARFALMMPAVAVLVDRAESLSKTAWKPFSADGKPKPAKAPTRKAMRRKRTRHRRRKARRRGYKNLTTTREWVAEFDYHLPRESRWNHLGLAGQRYRIVVRRQHVEVSQGQEHLYDDYRYYFIITNIPRRRMTAAAVLRFAYGRCDQENIIEQLKNGIAALRMPTGELRANHAFLMMGQLAWCLRSWLSLLALPKETLRWEWNWFRHAFVYVAAKITPHARRAVVYLAGSHRFVDHLVIASRRLHCFEFR